MCHFSFFSSFFIVYFYLIKFLLGYCRYADTFRSDGQLLKLYTQLVECFRKRFLISNHLISHQVVCLLDPTENDDMNVLRVNRSREKMYVFDNAFGPFSTQVRILLYLDFFRCLFGRILFCDKSCNHLD